MTTQTSLTNLTTINDPISGQLQVAKLPLEHDTSYHYYSDWVAYNGNAHNYEIRFRLSHSHAVRLNLEPQ